MADGFQADAFQNDAFQVGAGTAKGSFNLPAAAALAAVALAIHSREADQEMKKVARRKGEEEFLGLLFGQGFFD
jgi:hypothetical protein